MRITDKTRNATISPDARLTRSFWGRFMGLMLSKRRDLVLAGRRDSILDSTIHMMNMLYPIDVIWVDSKMRVADTMRGVMPVSIFKPKTWRLYRPARPARYVIELGTTKLSGVEVGDEISFDD